MITLRYLFLASTLILSSHLVLVPASVAKDKQEQQRISKSQAAQKALQAVPGKVLKVESRGSVYRVKIHQKSGRVVYVTVDAITGKVSS
ncbi:MAG: putative membrane protein YkoI [Gammaproteobacteria bacterium]